MFTVVGLRRIIPKREGPQRRPTPCSWPLLLPGITQPPFELCRLRKQIAPTALPQCKRPINRFCKTSHHQFDIARFKGGEDEQIGIWLNAGTRIRTAPNGANLFACVPRPPKLPRLRARREAPRNMWKLHRSLLIGHPGHYPAAKRCVRSLVEQRNAAEAFQWKRSGGLVTLSCLKAGCFSGSRSTTKRACRAFHSDTRPKPKLLQAVITWWRR